MNTILQPALPSVRRKPCRPSLPRNPHTALAPFPAKANTLNSPDGAARASWRILVIDDDPGIRYVMGELLGRAGHSVSTAEDGESGWKALLNDTFDVLVTDHDMPRLTGIDLLRRMRARAMDLPVILVSGCMPWDAPDLPELLEPGKTLEKPFSFAELVDAIGSVLTPKLHSSPSI